MRNDVSAAVDSNGWACGFLSPDLRICRMADGARRTYAKVEPAAAQAELARLRGLTVAVDPQAVAQWEEAEAAKRAKAAAEKKKGPLNPMDDPNDDRPMWQKREAWENMQGKGRGFGGGVGGAGGGRSCGPIGGDGIP